ncbi:MAG: hypothetical protein ACR2GQ_10355 [Gemmatimonadota bacterium]|jgi:hypothetical protein
MSPRGGKATTRGKKKAPARKKASTRKAPARKRSSSSRKPGQRVGTVRRQIIVAVAALSIPAGLLVSIRRSAEGTRLAETLADMRRETRLLDESLGDERIRVDSLTSRERVGRLAAELGLRQATDDEVVILRDDLRSSAGNEGS